MAVGLTTATAKRVPSLWGDQGDGTYRNPILDADYSDTDAIRVGRDFYLVASDFHFVGMQVLQSPDLVNWRIIGQVFDRLTVNPRYDRMTGYAQGTWAPSIRYHNGQFYVYVCMPHDGLFMWHARHPAGPWSRSVTVRAVDGWEDPCPFWDDDGCAWLVHSHKGAGPILLHRMSDDGTRLLDEGVEIYHGPVAEGPKLFKRKGWYYISLPEGGVDTGWQTILRSRRITGPYERRVVLPPGSPHQGAIIDLPNGQSWFIAFKSAGWQGRVDYLLPVTWGADDWPIFGDRGQPVLRWTKPDVGDRSPAAWPQTSDDFDGPMQPQWQWNHNPVNSGWSLTARPGWLRLDALPASEPEFARNTLTQKLWGQYGRIEAKLDVTGLRDNEVAGLTFLSGHRFDWAGVRQILGMRNVVWSVSGVNGVGPAAPDFLWIRGEYDHGIASFAYSLDGKRFFTIPGSAVLRFADWKGARFGLLGYHTPRGSAGGHFDVDYVHVVHQ